VRYPRAADVIPVAAASGRRTVRCLSLALDQGAQRRVGIVSEWRVIHLSPSSSVLDGGLAGAR
jgi:hypothetical protein